MNSNLDPVVRVVRRLPFPAERVFDAWLDPATAAKWLFATPTGTMVRAEIDPRVGGKYTFVDRRNGEDVEHTGEYLEIERPGRLVFTFGVPKFSPDFVRLVIEITSIDSGCELTLTQLGTPQQWVSRTQDGWVQILRGLAASMGDQTALINREPGQFAAPGEVRFVRLLSGPIERAWDYLISSDKRAKWFASGPMEQQIGGRVDLLFKHSNISPTETPPEKYRDVHSPGISMVARITQFDPPRLLGMTWEGESPSDESEVAFELTPEGENVRLVFRHFRLGSETDRKSVSVGWHLHLDILDALLSGTTPPPLWAAHERLERTYGTSPK